MQADQSTGVQQLAGNGAGKPEPDQRSQRRYGNEWWNGAAPAGAALPSVASNSDFGGDSVAISGQSGQVSPLAGINIDQIRDELAGVPGANRWTGRRRGRLFGGGGGGFGGGGFGGGGGGGGFGGPGGGLGGGRGNFRGFNPGQPHGAIFWIGTNSALNAEPFALPGQPQVQPASGTNRFGLTFMSAPYIPHLTKPSGKDTVFLTLSGSRSSNPEDFYGTVPTLAERSGDFSAAAPHLQPGYRQQFNANGTPNVFRRDRISSPGNGAADLLSRRQT